MVKNQVFVSFIPNHGLEIYKLSKKKGGGNWHNFLRLDVTEIKLLYQIATKISKY